jgi:flagellar biogenesis protein FliO
MDVIMPSNTIAKTTCVLCALLFSISYFSYSSAQSQIELRDIESRQDERVPYGGFVDRLSRGGSETRASEAPFVQRASHPYRDNAAEFVESPPRIASGETAVTLRPQAMSVRPSVRQASFEPIDRGGENLDPLRADARHSLDRMNAEEHLQSFIDRENADAPEKSANASDMVTRIGVNLVFVLALAVGGILLVKHFQKGKLVAGGATPEGLAGLKIDQVLQVTRGVSLYLVDGMSSKVLVAVDSGGIKSVNVLPGRFEDALDEPEAFSQSRESQSVESRPAVSPSVSQRRSQRRSSRRSINETSTSEIDENLIKLLLNKAKEAA